MTADAMAPAAMATGRYDLQYDPALPLDERVRRAVGMYVEKCGQYPTLAQVNPVHLEQPITLTVDDHPIKVLPCPRIGKLITYIGIGR